LVDLPDVDQTLNFDILGMTMGYENVSLGLWHLYSLLSQQNKKAEISLGLGLDWIPHYVWCIWSIWN